MTSRRRELTTPQSIGARCSSVVDRQLLGRDQVPETCRPAPVAPRERAGRDDGPRRGVDVGSRSAAHASTLRTAGPAGATTRRRRPEHQVRCPPVSNEVRNMRGPAAYGTPQHAPGCVVYPRQDRPDRRHTAVMKHDIRRDAALHSGSLTSFDTSFAQTIGQARTAPDKRGYRQ